MATTQVLLGSAILLGVSVARADVVPPPATGCPPGAKGVSSHAGAICVPWSCRDNADCRPGFTCGVQQLCMVQRSYTNWLGHQTVMVAEGTCDAGRCAAGICRGGRVCIPAVQATGGAPGTGGSDTEGADRGDLAPDLGTDEAAAQRREVTAPEAEETDPTTPPVRRKPAAAGCSRWAVTGAIAGGLLVVFIVLLLLLLRRGRPGAGPPPR